MLIKKILKAFKQFQYIPKTKHKPYLVIVYDLIYWIISSRGGINVYFENELFLTGKKASEYIKPWQFKKIEKKLNSIDYYPILEDKYFFYQILKGQGFNMPRTLFLIDQKTFFNIETSKYVTEEVFLEKNIDGFCKVINGFGGKMVYRFEIFKKELRINGKFMSVSDFYKLLGNKKFLVQERIIQHDDMNVLNPSCVNTMRIITIKTGQTIHIFQLYLRVGVNNSYVDNVLSGNILVGIDREKGTLAEYAFTHNVGQLKIDKHPQTKTIFKDFHLPYFNESIDMVKSLHILFQQFFIIGWDIGITPNGPIVLEGNNITELAPFQLLYGGVKSSFLEYVDKYQNLQ